MKKRISAEISYPVPGAILSQTIALNAGIALVAEWKIVPDSGNLAGTVTLELHRLFQEPTSARKLIKVRKPVQEVSK